MTTTSNRQYSVGEEQGADPLQLRDIDDATRAKAPEVHVYGPGAVCDTDSRGYATPGNRAPTEIVVDASEGFVPLWEPGVMLRRRFNEQALLAFRNPEAAKAAIRRLLGSAVLAWGDAAPVKFTERNDGWDFEIVVRNTDRCSVNGCVLASAFFPDSGRHELVIYPQMFQQSETEQVETLVHKIGHVFRLRHFFANIRETRWPSHTFGTHRPLSIMNYGSQSQLTELDRSDLKALYQAVWSGQLPEINGTQVRLMKPFHAAGVRLNQSPFAAV